MAFPTTRLPTLASASRLCAALALLAIAAPDRAGAASNGCESAKALTLIGKPAPADAEVKAMTGAKTVRRVAPGDAATLDFEPDRVTIEIENGNVTFTRCG